MDTNLKPQECKLTSKINEKGEYDCGIIYKVKRNSEYNTKSYKIHLKMLKRHATEILRFHKHRKFDYQKRRIKSKRLCFVEYFGTYNNNNNIYLLQLGCHPVAVVILHVNKTWNWLLLNLSREGHMRSM